MNKPSTITLPGGDMVDKFEKWLDKRHIRYEIVDIGVYSLTNSKMYVRFCVPMTDEEFEQAQKYLYRITQKR